MQKTVKSGVFLKFQRLKAQTSLLVSCYDLRISAKQILLTYLVF